MAVRPIDAEKYMELLKEQYLHNKSMGNSQAARAWQGAMQLLYDMPTLTPPNEPLTLEELREMDGEPVWIVEHPDWGHWELSADAEDYIADRDQDLYGLKHDDPAGQCGLHVLGWLAYRRPPEGEV